MADVCAFSTEQLSTKEADSDRALLGWRTVQRLAVLLSALASAGRTRVSLAVI